MTKVQLEYDILRPIGEELMERIARAHGVYGILRISLSPSLEKLSVEYDASRLTPVEVETVLHQMGIPVVLHV